MLNAAVEARVAIILVNWNGWRECIECIDSLLLQSYRSMHIFVVDNASTDGSIQELVEWCAAPQRAPTWRTFPGVTRWTDQPKPRLISNRVVGAAPVVSAPPAGCALTIIPAGANRGFAAGCNVGVLAAGSANFDYFWFLNPDTVADRKALEELIGRAGRSARIGIVGSTLRYYDQPDTIQSMGGGRLVRSNGTSFLIGQGRELHTLPRDPTAVEREMAYVMGASMLVSAEFIAEVGLMEEDYFLYYEEIDWALRGAPRFSLGFAPGSHVFHKSGANSSKLMPLFTARYYYRNRLKFVARFLPDRMAAAKRALWEQLLRHLMRGRWGHARVVLDTLMARSITDGATRRAGAVQNRSA